MAIPDVQRPADDPYSLIGSNWPSESEGAYHVAEVAADDASAAARTQAESADDAAGKTDSGMQGKTADSVSGGYAHAAGQLHRQSTDYTTISAWMLDASGKVRTAKTSISDLVSAGTSEIRDALDSEMAGTAVTPSSTDLTTQYRNDIASVTSKLATELDNIGHSLAGTTGSSVTPSYTSVPLTATPQHPSSVTQVAAYNHGEQPAVEPHTLPEMPRAVNSSSVESPSASGAPSAPTAPTRPVNPTLANLISPSGAGSSTPPSTNSPHVPTGQGAQARQTTEQHRQASKSAGIPRIPPVSLPDIPAVASSITTAVTSAASGTQLPVTTAAPTTPTVPASTGFTPGTSGTFPMTAGGLSPIGGGLPTAPVTQATSPAVQGTPTPPAPGLQAPSAPQQSPAPAALRGPVVDAAWLQQRYGVVPGLDLAKSENSIAPALFVAELPEAEAHLHRVLASIRQEFEQAGWSQPIAVATLRRGFETKTVYVTADALSIRPHGVLLPSGVLPLDEIAGVSSTSELSGSLMVSEKFVSMIPRGWEVEAMLSTVSGEESSQTAEQFQELVEGDELLSCKVSRGQEGVSDDEAMSMFARVAIGSAGCSELDVESSRLRAARWVGVQSAGYLDGLSRYYLADAAESMSQGAWGEAVYASEKYLSVTDTKQQVA